MKLDTGNPWIQITLPDSMDYSARAQAGYPALVQRAIAAGSRVIRLPSLLRSQEASAVLAAFPTARVERYFRNPNDPYQDCPWDHIGVGCRCSRSCSE